MPETPQHGHFLIELQSAVGRDRVLVDPDIMQPFANDWTGRWRGHPLAVVRPRNTAEVRAAVQVCALRGVPVVPQGGNTGLVAGAVAPKGSVLLSTTHLDSMEPVDLAARQVTVSAGVTIANLQRHVRQQGLDYGVDLGSRDSATVGGTIATNAGGTRVVLRGDSRAQVIGLEAVLADGSVMSHLSGLPKDSAGFDLSNLLVASEGTLGIVTRARLRLTPPLPQERTTTLVGLPGIGAALTVLATNRGPQLLAAEFLTGNCMELVCRIAGLVHPLSGHWPIYLLLEVTGDPVIGIDVDGSVDARLWAYRERQTEVISSLGQVHKLDVGVPMHQLARCLAELPAIVAPHDLYVFGHLAEGNLHVEIVGPTYEDDTSEVAVLEYVASLGGTISAEHGVGRAKAKHLHLSRDAATLTAMRAVKGALDPHNLMNPGVLLS